jgi:hypothetical protein
MTDSLAQSPLTPPSYLTDSGNPHKYGILVDEPPVCSRCSEQPESAPKLQQHVRVTKTSSMVIKVPKRLANQAGMISLSHPLDVITDKESNGGQSSHLTPTWMTLLPSSRKPFAGAPRQTMANRRSTFPEYEPVQSSTPSPSPHLPLIKDSRIDPPLASKNVSKADSVPGRRDTRGPRGVPRPVDHHPLGPDRGIRRESPPDHLPPSNSVSTTADQEINQGTAFDRNNRHSFPQQLFNRSNSLQRRRFSLRKTPTAGTIVPAGSCGPEKSHSPMPSQDISPTRAPLLRELSSFFATRAGK